mgnify:CR=1 FL=1
MEALKEAIYNGVTSLKYIERILYDWRKKGYKTKDGEIVVVIDKVLKTITQTFINDLISICVDRNKF